MIGKEDLPGLMGLVDLRVEEKRLPVVLENLQRVEQVYQVVAAVELDAADEIGPEWRP